MGSDAQCPGIQFLSGEVEFTDGATYNTASRALCYLGSQTATPVDLVEEFDCKSYLETAPRTPDGDPYLVIDTRETKTWNLGSSITGGFSCPINLVSCCLLKAYGLVTYGLCMWSLCQTFWKSWLLLFALLRLHFPILSLRLFYSPHSFSVAMLVLMKPEAKIIEAPPTSWAVTRFFTPFVLQQYRCLAGAFHPFIL